MNAIISELYRDLVCAAASALITLVLAVSFVESTSVPYGMHAAVSTTQAQQPLVA
jgi:uncharacterized protein YsxB (DUF464 family)